MIERKRDIDLHQKRCEKVTLKIRKKLPDIGNEEKIAKVILTASIRKH